ncbi:PAS domain-containing sensor histidine kinase [Halomonas sp. CH40]
MSTAEPLSLEKQFSLRDLFDLSDALVVATNVDKRVVYANPAFCKISGYSADEVQGAHPRTWSSIYTPYSTHEKVKTALAEGRAWVGRYTNRTKYGDLWVEERTVQPLFAPDASVIGYLSMGYNVEDIEPSTERLVTLESQYVLASSATHELNNMLGVIHGLAEVNLVTFGEKTMVADRRENLQAILHACQEAEAMVKRLRGGLQAPTPQCLDLTRLLRTMQPVLSKTLPKPLMLELATPDTPVFVNIDETYLLLMLVNLLKNAGEATHGTPRPQVTLTLSQVGAAGAVTLMVEDNGCGMSEEVQQNLFTPLFTTKSSRGGTGLGMLQVKHFLETHSASFDVESTLGEGTTMKVTLPLNVSKCAIC